MSNDEDAWNLEDSDGEGTSTHTTRHIKAGSSSGTDHIARVAAQAGLGRRAGPASSASSGSRTHGLNNGSTASIIAFPSSLSSSLPTAAAVAASLNGGTASAIQSTSLAQASTSSAILSKSPPPPSTTAEKRGRQTSYGFWGRLSGAVGVGSSSSPKESSSKSTDNLAEMSGYSRFDDQLELEDNFDGTYSVNPGSASGGSVGAGSGGKLMAAASIARPSLLAAGNARSLGKVPQVPASGSSASKGKSRLTDSPGGATIVGTPRPRSPFTKLKKLDRPRDEEEMRKYVRKDIDDVLQGENGSSLRNDAQEVAMDGDLIRCLDSFTPGVNAIRSCKSSQDTLVERPCDAHHARREPQSSRRRWRLLHSIRFATGSVICHFRRGLRRPIA